MSQHIPRIAIEGKDVDFFGGQYASPGIFSAASLNFSIPTEIAGAQKLWNKEVTFYVDKSDSVPVFRGWIKRTKKSIEKIEVFAEDAIGYMIKGGSTSIAQVNLDERINLDGLTAGAAIIKILELAELDTKLKTDYIGNTSPVVATVRPPIRGEKTVKSIIEDVMSQSINTDDTSLPRPNIVRLIDDGTNSQIIIELESNLDTAPIKHIYNTKDNITSLQIINKKIPTVIEVKGKNGVSGKFTHTSAIAAQDRDYLSVTNDSLESPAECKEFAARLFQANLKAQYEYSLEVTEGAYLNENDVIRLDVEPSEFSGNYRVIGKTIIFDESSFRIGININKKPPTLAEYISSRDN
tara:strand:- start:18941 stop:19996 length:1056 start_codon:yes stop_codon:yes gene_type:complete